MGDDGGSSQRRPSLLTIGRFARLAGLSVPQLRHYDRLGILVPAVRDRRSGYRYYRWSQIAPARVIALLRSIDMPLADVQGLLAGPEPERIRQVFATHRARIERRLSAARTALESIDRVMWEDQLMHVDAETRCSFCGRPSIEGPARLAGPGRVRICAQCVELAHEVLELDRQGKYEKPRRAPGQPTLRAACSFCGRDSRSVHKLVAGPGVYICDGCLGTATA